MTTFTLTTDQQNALNAFTHFLSDPVETVFVLSGYSGTGKSTLVKYLIDQLPGFMKTFKLINPSQKDYVLQLTATTNKAAESLAHITGMDVATIHSFLQLRVHTDYKSGVTKLIPRNQDVQEGFLLFIDEASYVDSNLLQLIFSKVRNCKIVFMGDPAQLTPVKSQGTPVFDANFCGAKLEQVVRQAEGNPIVDLSAKFRNTVNSGEFFSFTPDGHHIQYMNRDDFDNAIKAEFLRPNWRYSDSKVLAWTNARVIAYNHAIRDLVEGDPHFQTGDYAVVNKFVSASSKSLKTDQLVQITGISHETEEYGVKGHMYTIDNSAVFFGPKNLKDKKEFIKKARANEQLSLVALAEDRWIDLRAAYAATVNKSQGSTYDRVFVDLDDIRRCNSGDQIARMLYVAVSRARHTVYLTGDIA